MSPSPLPNHRRNHQYGYRYCSTADDCCTAAEDATDTDCFAISSPSVQIAAAGIPDQPPSKLSAIVILVLQMSKLT